MCGLVDQIFGKPAMRADALNILDDPANTVGISQRDLKKARESIIRATEPRPPWKDQDFREKLCITVVALAAIALLAIYVYVMICIQQPTFNRELLIIPAIKV